MTKEEEIAEFIQARSFQLDLWLSHQKCTPLPEHIHFAAATAAVAADPVFGYQDVILTSYFQLFFAGIAPAFQS